MFLPGEIFGKPDAIVKDPLGKILCEDYREDDEPSTVERFECENCGKPIVVEATLTFKTRKEEAELDFTEEYVSLLSD